jgi:hypothetical protein
MNIIQTATSQPGEIKPDRQRQIVIILSDRSREIIRLFEELHRKRKQTQIGKDAPAAHGESW